MRLNEFTVYSLRFTAWRYRATSLRKYHATIRITIGAAAPNCKL